jgi:hypothetical protein
MHTANYQALSVFAIVNQPIPGKPRERRPVAFGCAGFARVVEGRKRSDLARTVAQNRFLIRLRSKRVFSVLEWALADRASDRPNPPRDAPEWASAHRIYGRFTVNRGGIPGAGAP